MEIDIYPLRIHLEHVVFQVACRGSRGEGLTAQTLIEILLPIDDRPI